MTWWDRAQAWVKSWEGALALLGAIGVALAATRKMVASIARRIIGLVTFYLNGDKHHAEIVERLNCLDRGQLDIIQTRGHVMDFDKRMAYFKFSPDGKCIWASELWRKLTGLSAEEAYGYGWELGIEENDRPRVLQNWQLAVAHGRRYEDTVKYFDRHSGTVTRVKVVGSPVRDKDGTVLSWNLGAEAI